MMTPQSIKDLFASDISRRIEEVIKVDQDDEEIVRDEIDEYVVTDAIRGHYTSIFDAYQQTPNRPHEGIAVWVSGFFGSGKSSFAKMLGLMSRRKPGHTLMFVVDEVGQFVARDVQKMLDLQAVVQSLGVRGRGRHWLVALNDAIDREIVELFRSREMLLRTERGTKGQDTPALMAEERRRQRPHHEELRRRLRNACLAGRVYFHGNDRTPIDRGVDAALSGLREECARLIGAAKKVVVS
ncbi:hypothetical protein [Frankia sp. Cr2]|uniref:hypothetical protein n=1 Tax=Frankia sp. Cr2 TaxID=3073932 RepID=UPI002AD4CE33|nr:hypothetical protein [Frankia sp. Cr2]